jgi:transcriptional regulator with XRE-family HTH domain
MSLISKGFAKELAGKRGFRHRYLGAQTCTKIVRQIRALRRQRGWSQAEFAKRLRKPQSNVSQRLENLDYTGFTLNTLLEVAEACDVGLIVEFVPYKNFIRRTNDLSTSALEVPEFAEQELDELCGDDEQAEAPPPKSPTNHIGTVLDPLSTQGVIQLAGQSSPEYPFLHGPLNTLLPAGGAIITPGTMPQQCGIRFETATGNTLGNFALQNQTQQLHRDMVGAVFQPLSRQSVSPGTSARLQPANAGTGSENRVL